MTNQSNLKSMGSTINQNLKSADASKPASKIGFIPNEKPTVNMHQSINFNWQVAHISNTDENLKTDTSENQKPMMSQRAKSNGRSNLFMPKNETLAFFDQARKVQDQKNISSSQNTLFNK